MRSRDELRVEMMLSQPRLRRNRNKAENDLILFFHDLRMAMAKNKYLENIGSIGVED